MSERLGGGDYPETRRDPEVDELLEFLSDYKKIQGIMAWLIEASPGADPVVTAVRRGQLHGLMQKLGLDPESPDALVQLQEMSTELSDRTLHPKPVVDVPEASYFKSRIKEIVREHERFGAPPAIGCALEERADIVGVAQFGHTNWANVHSRVGGQDSEWIHGIAKIMADPVAYQAGFAGLGIGTGYKAMDHLQVAEDWSIQNGRHRSLAARSLGEGYVQEAGMAQWVKVAVEQP